MFFDEIHSFRTRFWLWHGPPLGYDGSQPDCRLLIARPERRHDTTSVKVGLFVRAAALDMVAIWCDLLQTDISIYNHIWSRETFLGLVCNTS